MGELEDRAGALEERRLEAECVAAAKKVEASREQAIRDAAADSRVRELVALLEKSKVRPWPLYRKGKKDTFLNQYAWHYQTVGDVGWLFTSVLMNYGADFGPSGTPISTRVVGRKGNLYNSSFSAAKENDRYVRGVREAYFIEVQEEVCMGGASDDDWAKMAYCVMYKQPVAMDGLRKAAPHYSFNI